MQRGDAFAGDQDAQRHRITMLARTRQHQPGTGLQRPEEFPDRDVEAEGRLLQDMVARIQPIGGLHPLQAVVQRRLGVAGTLGSAGGTRGVDQIGQLLGMDLQGWRSGRLGGQVQPLQVQHIQPDITGQHGQGRAMAQ